MSLNLTKAVYVPDLFLEISNCNLVVVSLKLNTILEGSSTLLFITKLKSIVLSKLYALYSFGYIFKYSPHVDFIEKNKEIVSPAE